MEEGYGGSEKQPHLKCHSCALEAVTLSVFYCLVTPLGRILVTAEFDTAV